MAKKPIFRKLTNLFLLLIMVSLNLPADARRNASLVEFISGSQPDMNLFILDKDIELDLGRESARLRMFMDSQPLLVKNSYPQSFKIVTYSFATGGEKVLHSTVQHTVRRRNRSRVRFTIDLGYVEGDQDFYFEFYDSADRIVNTYRQTIDFSNLQEQVADTAPIAAADCDNTSFNDCHLDYIMEKINFLLEPKNTNYSNKIKNPNGSYNVVLSIPKSVREQILRGNFDIQGSGFGALGGANGDNLGNHMATQDLDMKFFDIRKVTEISTANLSVGTTLESTGLTKLDIVELEDNGSLTIPNGAANGYVLTSDSNGNATWQPLLAVLNGDNLGNHMATQDLDMKGFNIVNADMLEVESVKINGALAYTNGAVDGFVLTSDSNGNGHWRPVNTVVNGDGLGNHTADINLDMNGHDIVAAQQINADELIANTIDVTTVETGAQIHSPTLHGTIDVNGHLFIPDGAVAGYVLTSDNNGKAAWALNAGGGANGDNLGNHIATTDLNMATNDIHNAMNMTAFNIRSLITANFKDVEINGSLAYPVGAALGHVLTSDANGMASWQAVGAADNLGNHTATTMLDMNNNDIVSVNHISLTNGLTLFKDAGLGKVLSSDANGNASWQSPIGDDLGNHIADQTLYMNGNSISYAGGLSMHLESQTGNGTININWEHRNLHEVTLTGNSTLFFTNTPSFNANLVLVVQQDATGGRTLSYPASVKWPGGVAPTLSTNGNALDIIDCFYRLSGFTYFCNMRENNYQ